jgi:hypothetical protein
VAESTQIKRFRTENIIRPDLTSKTKTKNVKNQNEDPLKVDTLAKRQDSEDTRFLPKFDEAKSS